MPIQGLRKAATFPEIGQLRKGAPKPNEKQPGQDLKHFRLTTDDEDVAALFQEVYGDEPRTINVLFPFATMDENFEAWQEEWVAGGLKHRCDGVTCVRWLQPDGKYSDKPKPCPGKCKPAGRLKVIIPELKRLAYVTVLTTSLNDILEIQANLEAASMMRSDDLRGIPFILKRSPREISTPRDGKRVRAEKWLISVEVAPSFVLPQLAYIQQAALPQMRALPDGGGVVDTNTGEIHDEPEPEYTVEDEPASEPTPKVVQFDAAKARAKIKRLWAEERGLLDQLYLNDEASIKAALEDQNTEVDQDLTRLNDQKLTELGGYVKARVESLRLAVADLDTAGQSTDAAA